MKCGIISLINKKKRKIFMQSLKVFFISMKLKKEQEEESDDEGTECLDPTLFLFVLFLFLLLFV